MRISNWKVMRVSSAAFFSPAVAVFLASITIASISQVATAEEATAEVKSAENANLEGPQANEVTGALSRGDASPDSAAATIQKASLQNAPQEVATEDDSKVVSAEGGTESDVSTIALASLAMVNSHSLAMTAIHNNYRSQAGLETQAVDPNLSNVAQNWANHMASVGSMYHGGGEQIIAYSGGDLSYEAGFRLWLNSSPHRAWLYSRGNRCGFGYAIGRNGCAYFAGAFGSSQNSVSSESNSYSGGYQSANSGRRFRVFRRRS